MKTFKLCVLMLLCVMLLGAARAPIQQGLTSHQVAFKYSRPDANACTWEVSTSATYSPLVADVQGAGGQDSGVLGTRWFLVGTATPLLASTVHYWRETCGAEVYTGQFTTPAAVNPVTFSGFHSMGGHPLANKARFDYGPTPALGNSITAPCTPACMVTGIQGTQDSFLFFRVSYLNETDVVATGDLHLMVNR